ncbi:extracellular solute-binding protein [Rhodobacteraceae bacterium RKSG542]|uniref:extracellular solute-binding protein n=1 Tax=Pseudovibrio flavus TaxID=2529854 RepID=UPI0012BD2329|nr:extracellular solute-binding protein [Pseudovibrio flavus]MTI15948.1 extracellular solute-binding protein [Pseudovibrio flavus]
MRKSIIAAVAGSFFAVGMAQAEETTIRVHYAHPNIFSKIQEKLAVAFEAEHPEIKLDFDAPAESYETGVQSLLRDAVANKLPDVAFAGLSTWRILEARGLTVPLDEFIGDEAAFEAQGYTPALRSLGQYNGKQHALAVAASTLVVYANPELVERAGGDMDNFPTDFDGLIELSAKINELDRRIEGAWVSPHDWRFQSFLGSFGGRPLNADETKVTFDSEAGIAAATVYSRLAEEGGMQFYEDSVARQAFNAGTLGLYIDSSSLMARVIEGAGDRFEVSVQPFPIAAEDKASVYLPTGGSGMVMLTEDKAKQDAVWKYMQFVSGPKGAKIIVENSGYAPTNSLVVEDESYLGDFYKSNAGARVAHAQVANYAGPWYAFPGDEGVAVTDVILAGLIEVIEGEDPEEIIKDVAAEVRDSLELN